MAITADFRGFGTDEALSDELLRRALIDEPGRFFDDDRLVMFYPAEWGYDAPSIACVYDPRFGYSLVWGREDKNLPVKQRDMMSVSNARLMAVPVDHPIEEVRPRGSFVRGEVLLRVLQDFDRRPDGAVGGGQVDALCRRAREREAEHLTSGRAARPRPVRLPATDDTGLQPMRAAGRRDGGGGPVPLRVDVRWAPDGGPVGRGTPAAGLCERARELFRRGTPS